MVLQVLTSKAIPADPCPAEDQTAELLLEVLHTFVMLPQSTL